MYKIYKIIKPNDNNIYIGKTKMTLEKRLKSHFYDQKYYPNRKIYQWLDKSCIIELIEITENISREKYWTDFYKKSLVNTVSGNTGLSKKEYSDSYEQTEERKQSRKNREQTEEYKEKRNNKSKAFYETEERQQYLKEYHKTDKYKEYQKAYSNTPENKAKRKLKRQQKNKLKV